MLRRWIAQAKGQWPETPEPKGKTSAEAKLPPPVASLAGAIDIGLLHGETVTFGVVSDTHLASTKERLDILEAAYDVFADRGISRVLHAGNLVEGLSRFNRFELKCTGFDDQLNNAAEHYPQRSGIVTHYIDADDHEGWWRQREGLYFGSALAAKREDLQYLGYLEADIKLGASFVRVFHPGGGVPYAHSYVPQKIIESYESGKKPGVLIIGHHHKLLCGIDREVFWLMAGCTQEQTFFMRKKKIAAHKGFTVLHIQLDAAGVISHVTPDIYRFYDKAYYERLAAASA